MLFVRRMNVYFLCAVISGVVGTLLYRAPVFEKQELVCGFLFGAGAVLLIHGCYALLRSVIYFLRSLLFIGENLSEMESEVNEHK